MLDLVKALAHVDRLQIIGILAYGPASRDQVTASLSLPLRQVYNHLEFLKYVQVIHENDGVFSLDSLALETISRSQLIIQSKPKPPVHDPDPGRQKILASCLRPDGTIRRIPSSRTQAHAFRILLEYLAASFESGIDYTEKEVNAILSRFHPDSAGLRRDLIDAGLLDREQDGSRYWRVETR